MKAECFKTASWVQTMKQSLELNNTYFYYSNLSKSLKITKAILKYLLSIRSVKARGCTQWVHMETIALIASGDARASHTLTLQDESTRRLVEGPPRLHIALQLSKIRHYTGLTPLLGFSFVLQYQQLFLFP